MAKETDGRGCATMNEADIEYLRNINTRPGPNAGHSINPTKPGPDDGLPREHQDPSKWSRRETMERAHAARFDAEPVAWQYRFHIHGEWIAWKETLNPKYWRKQTGTEVRPLYTAPPRPDASAGLIEAAEMAEECANECLGVKAPLSAYALRDFAKVLRERAADRSGK